MSKKHCQRFNYMLSYIEAWPSLLGHLYYNINMGQRICKKCCTRNIVFILLFLYLLLTTAMNLVIQNENSDSNTNNTK